MLKHCFFLFSVCMKIKYNDVEKKKDNKNRININENISKVP